jgi:hypothetical protein
MKKGMINFKTMVITAFIALGITISPASFADGVTNEKSATELKFIGNIDNQPLFQLSLNNTEEDEYTISISDIYGNVLYSDRIKGINVSTKFRLNTDEIGYGTLKVKVRSKKANKLEIYEIRKSSRQVEEAYVNKL